MQTPSDAPHRVRPASRRRSLLRDRRGIVAIMLGLLALPLIGIVGLAVDYGFATRAQALLNSAADSAAVAATDAAANAYANRAIGTVANFSPPAVAAGTQAFNAQAVNIPNVTVNPISITVTQTADSATFTSVVAYTASYRTWFGVLFGVPNFPLGGGSTAQIAMTTYQDFHILMDATGSMSIAADTAGMATLAALTLIASNDAYQNFSPYNQPDSGQNSFLGQGSQNCPHSTTSHGVTTTTYQCGAAQSTTQGCAFACHWDTTGNSCSSKAGCDFYEIAKGANPARTVVRLRQDEEQTAVQQVITTMNTQDIYAQYRAAVYAFYTQFSTSGSTTTISGNLSQISALPAATNVAATSQANLTAAGTAAASWAQPIAGTDNSNNTSPASWKNWPEPNTNFGAALTALAAGMNCPGTNGTYIPCPGNGTTYLTPQEFLFVITDGIEDFCTSVSGTSGCNGRTIQPIQASECAALKAIGVQILVLYVQYVPLDQNPYYNGFYVNDGLSSGGVQSFVDPDGANNVPTSPPYPAGTVPYNLQQCSSPNYPLFYAGNSAQIATQLQAMLQAAENQGVRLLR